MKTLNYRLISIRAIFSLIAFIFIAVASNLSAQTYSVPSTSTTGTYVVSYSTPSTYGLIDELVDGSWRTIGGGNASGSLSVTKTVNGTYTYRMQNCTAGQGGHSCFVVSGTKSITVTIPSSSISSSSISSSSRSSSTPAVDTTAYVYDALGRLTFVNDTVNGNRDYDYDKAGNRLLVTTNLATDAATEPAP